MKLLKNKKAYFFLIDAIFAVVILLIGFMIISSGKPVKTDFIPLPVASENLMDILSSVRIDEMCSDGCNSCTDSKIKDLCNSGDIRNKNQSILDYLGELYSFNKKEDAADVFNSIAVSGNLYRDDLYGVEFLINNERIFPKIWISVSKDSSWNLITNKKVIFGYYEDYSNGDVGFWGPYIVELNMWEK